MRLQREGIDARPFLFPVSRMPMYRSRYHHPVAERISSYGMNLPSGVNLKKHDVQRIAQNVKRCLKKK
jgi:perosamine synthetase